MPSRAATPCGKPGCNGLVRDAKCSICGPVRRHSTWANKEYDKARGTPAQRGYGHNWQKLRKMILADSLHESHGPLCVECRRQGKTVIATDVDHILPKAQGGGDDWDNLQSLCSTCHKRKTAKDSRMRGKFEHSLIPVTIVAGAPGSGKTTWVSEHKTWGDLVVDVDALFVALSGGLDWYDKPLNLLPFVLEARDAVLHRLSSESEVRRCWLITSEADVDKLKQLKADLGADRLIVMDTDQFECYKRIANDERRSKQVKGQHELVDKWFAKFKSREMIGGK